MQASVFAKVLAGDHRLFRLTLGLSAFHHELLRKRLHQLFQAVFGLPDVPR